ncbi:MAG: hypothetical protein ACREBG_13185 [Pyrinomonadaceae bacterium]
MRRQIMRLTIFLPLTLVLSLACHWNRAGSSIEPPKTSIPTTSEAVAPPTSGSFTEADFVKHVAELKKKLPSNKFSVVIQSPFVVVGDEARGEVLQRAEGTVKWAVDQLKQDFFAKDPKEILDVWLFRDKESYEKYTRLIFGEDPTTPYGYYSSHHKALIMNIGTGGGTLVHEIVHPFMEANFPECPPWLNEGLGSLYEQCGEVDGHIHGFTNWRLPGLQQAIRAKEVPPFKTLMALDTTGFYNEDKGVNYGQARYLCYYLQQRGLLVKYYKQFHAHQKEDPSGYLTLRQVLAERDMDAFQKRWEKFVLGLRQGYEVTVE